MSRGLGWLVNAEEIAAGARLLARVPSFVRHPIGPERARAILHQRLERREADFLELARWAIYGTSGSPYLQLLRLAGCEFGDLERLVSQGGVEGALSALYRQGVYLTVAEFKGRQPAVRGSSTIAVEPARLRNRGSAYHLLIQSSGSRGAQTAVPLDLAYIQDRTVNACLFAEARGGRNWQLAFWGTPGGWPIFQCLLLSGMGTPPVRWFSQVDVATPGLSARYRWSSRVLRWGSSLGGVVLPQPMYVPLDDPLAIARWMAEVLRAGGTPHLHTFASPAVLLCQAAVEAGIELRGAQFRLAGEPTTAARLAAIRRAGADGVASYGVNEAGTFLAEGCLAPEAPDDVHLYHDLHALIQSDPVGRNTALPPQALLLSSLRPTAPFIMVNVSLGDQAVMVQRACGCPLERLGWRTHLHTIRSFEKLTTGGITLLDADVLRILEEVLPARFGGGLTDYQLLEEEGADGRPQLRLLVHPAVGPLDRESVAETFLAAIGGGSGGRRVAELLWRQASLLRVDRQVPFRTSAGKIHHLHLATAAGRSSGPA